MSFFQDGGDDIQPPLAASDGPHWPAKCTWRHLLTVCTTVPDP